MSSEIGKWVLGMTLGLLVIVLSMVLMNYGHGGQVAVFIILGLAVFLAIRSLVLWYWRLNEIVRLLAEINAKLGNAR